MEKNFLLYYTASSKQNNKNMYNFVYLFIKVSLMLLISPYIWLCILRWNRIQYINTEKNNILQTANDPYITNTSQKVA